MQIGTSQARARNRADRAGRPSGSKYAINSSDVLRKRVRIGLQRAPQRTRGRRIGARRAAETEIDAARKQRLERAELLRHDERRVVGQHDAARADPDRLGPGGHVRDHDRGGGAGDAGHVVMLRQPVAGDSPAARLAGRDRSALPKGRRGRAALRDGGEVEDREPEHPPSVTRRNDSTEAT